MTFFSEIEIDKLIIHAVGNKLKGDSMLCSDSTVIFASELNEILRKYFTNPFKSNELYKLDNIEDNEIYHSIKNIFSNPSVFADESKKMAKRLFEEMRNPKVSGGNLFVVFFHKCIINDEMTDAIGIFKAETSETFLKIKPSNERFAVEHEAGVSITKMTKGCIVFDYKEENGYLLSIVDKRSKNEEISYWTDNFLNAVVNEDDYFHTKSTISCLESFVSNALPEQFDVSRADQADLLNRTLEYFKENDDFDKEIFSEEVFQNQDIIDNFNTFYQNYQEDNDLEISGKFAIDKSAFKKQAKLLKTVIKLDDKFDIIIHKDNENLIRGEDEATGLQYYQLLFKEEV